jgi:hypothetical protein
MTYIWTFGIIQKKFFEFEKNFQNVFEENEKKGSYFS